MAIQTCKWEPTKLASACDALDLVSRWFGMNEEQIAARCGRFVRGRNKGKVRGWVVYRKCREGGWCFPVGGVIRPGIIYAHFVEKYDDLGQVMNYGSDKFVGWGSRVDTAYGHDPVAARAADAARIAAMPTREDMAREERRKIMDEAWDAMAQQDAEPTKLQIKLFNNFRDVYVEEGVVAAAGYMRESYELSAASAGGRI